jgi:hypothetical protein
MYFIKKKLKAKVLRRYYSEVTLAHSIFGINQYKKRMHSLFGQSDILIGLVANQRVAVSA